MGNHRQSHASYASSSHALDSHHAMSQLSRPLCLMCNMELDLHLSLGEPGSTETVCPVIVQAAALPDHHGPYAVGSPSQPGFIAASSSRSHSYESTKSSRSSGGGSSISSSSSSSSSHSYHRSSHHTGSSTSRDGHAHSSPPSHGKSKRSSAKSSAKSHSHSQQHSHRSESPSRKHHHYHHHHHHHHHNGPYSAADDAMEQDALRYSQVLPVQSFLFEEAWRSSD